MKRGILTFFMILGASLLWGGTLSGRVVNRATGEPLSNATIVITSSEQTVKPDPKGTFILENLSAGILKISAYHPGFSALHKEIKIQENQKTTLTLAMEAESVSESMTVTATRAIERKTPVVFTDVSEQTIKEEHTVEDVPMLLVGLPNVYAYSDDGSGMGYSYLKIRGFDQTRVGVMINGIPLNDPEDHQVYWVDMPDFAESLDSIQIQRGVGTSMYGVDTFGGSVNLLTTGQSQEDSFETTTYGGSYGTMKFGLHGNVALKGDMQLTFRGSYLETDGFRDNSGSEQWSGYLELARYSERSILRLITYTGNELTHAAWEASPEDVLRENPRHNPISYENTIDDFTQPHYELHHTLFLNDKIHWKNTLFAIHGKGYYEQYKDGRDMYEYGLWDDPGSAPEADIIRQKWVRKTQYGLISELGLDHQGGNLTFGAYWSTYNSHHWGEVDDLIGLELPNYVPEFVYHRYFSDKDYATFYVNELFNVNEKVTLMANLHYQRITYSLDQDEAGSFRGENLHSLEVDYNFLNPRIGVNVNVNEQLNVFGNISVAHREPADSQLFDTWMSASDFGVAPLFNQVEVRENNGTVERLFWTDPQVEEEEMVDYELGMTYRTSQFNIRANAFWMDFRNEIVPYGQVDDDGFPVRGNAEKTVHRGVELSGSVLLSSHWQFDANLSINDNTYKEFNYQEYDWGTGEVVELDFSGNTIAGFPDVIANSTLSYRTNRWMAALRWQHFGQQYLDNTENADRTISSYNLVNTWVKVDLPKMGRIDGVELSLRINNLLDETFYTAGYFDAWAGGNFYWPGADRSVMAGVRITY